MVTVGEFMKKVVLPIVIVGALLLLFKPMYMNDGKLNILNLWILVGIPFGMRRMCLWLIPRNYDIAGAIGIVAVNFIVGGLIGGVVVVVQLVQAVWYCLKCIAYGFRKNKYRSNVSN
jgi:hypothetical protein